MFHIKTNSQVKELIRIVVIDTGQLFYFFHPVRETVAVDKQSRSCFGGIVLAMDIGFQSLKK